jgi:phosphatidyl-myo-inositol dimannoside synthase
LPSRSDSRHRGPLLGLFTQLNGGGGIERASRHAAQVLFERAARENRQLRFLGLNDPSGVQSLTVAGQVITYEGFGRNKWRFTRAALADATTLALATHPNLAPVSGLVRQRYGAKTATVCWGIDVWERLPLHRRFGLRSSDVVLAISRFTRDQVVTLQGVDPNRVHLLPLALDPLVWERAQRAPGARPALLPPGRVLLSVARLAGSEGYKGVDTVVEAMPWLLKRFPDLHYVVVGNGDDRPRLESVAARCSVQSNVHFIGALDPQSSTLADCFAHAEVFVLPSSGEGFGLVFLEAMAFATPVVGGAHRGTLDVIEDAKSGYLVRHGDGAALATVLDALLSDSALRRSIGEAGRQRVEKNFLYAHFASRLNQILDPLLSA